MNQLELPTISFARYLDLLKRKTWSVILISMLGLLVGGLVATLIPRYYVAFTIVQFNKPVLDPAKGTPADPMAQVIESSKVTVMASVQKAIDNLGWPEAQSADHESRRQFVEGTRRRIDVHDDGPYNKGRLLARFRIMYQDIDGRRAMELCNEVRNVWLREFVDTLKEKASKEFQRIQDEVYKVTEQRNRLDLERQVYEKRNNIDPGNHLLPNQDNLTVYTRGLAEAQRNLLLAESGILAHKADVSQHKLLIEGTPKTTELTGAERFADPERKAAYTMLRNRILVAEASLKKWKPAHPAYSVAVANLESLKEQMLTLEEVAGGAVLEKKNPEYERLQGLLREASKQLKLAESTRELLNKRIAKLKEEIAKRPKIYAEYREIISRLQTLTKDLETLESEKRSKATVRRRINSERPYEILQEAYQPPAPTVPNRSLVTLLGCVIGLGAAVGLIILMDFLQATYKTVPEVERNLGLPVLGSMSHMETVEERESVRLRRLRLTIAAAIFLALLVAVVTIYYVRPASLPEWVREVLEAVLGPNKG